MLREVSITVTSRERVADIETAFEPVGERPGDHVESVRALPPFRRERWEASHPWAGHHRIGVGKGGIKPFSPLGVVHFSLPGDRNYLD
jgi:hypothetical protein